MNTRVRTQGQTLSLLAGVTLLCGINFPNVAQAADFVSFGSSGSDDLVIERDGQYVYAGATNTYTAKALNEELKADFRYAVGVAADNTGNVRAVDAWAFARTSGKVFDLVGDSLMVLAYFTGNEYSSQATASVDATVWRNGTVIRNRRLGTTSQTGATHQGNIIDTGSVNLYSTSKQFSVGPIPVTVTAHVSASVAIPFDGSYGTRGIQAGITPTANVWMDSSGSTGASGVAAVGMRFRNVELLNVSVPAQLGASIQGPCTGVGTCSFFLSTHASLQAKALTGRLEAFVTVPVVNQQCGWNWKTALFPIWTCFGIPGSKTYDREIWNSQGAQLSRVLFSANRGYVL